jgi:ribosomal protein S18 acetylase RimI-like enzyme
VIEVRRSVRISLTPFIAVFLLNPERISTMQFVDKALARRFEACEEMPQVLYARAFQKMRPEIGAAEEEICGGHMIFAGLGSPIGRATALGLDRAFTPDDLDRVEQFYRSHHAPAQVDLCPLHDLAVFEMCNLRGYSIAELNNVLYRPLDSNENFSDPPARCTIRRGRPEEARELGAIVERAFFPDGAPEACRDLLSPLYQMDGALTFAAEIDGKTAACGAGLVIPAHGIFAVCGAGTAAEFRGRGLQTALLQARLAAAAQEGCEHAVVVTQGGTTSQRNAERLGFRVAYSKVTVIKELEEG